MSRKSNRYKRRAEMEKHRADRAVARTRESLLGAFNSSIQTQLVVTLPNGDRLDFHRVYLKAELGPRSKVKAIVAESLAESMYTSEEPTHA